MTQLPLEDYLAYFQQAEVILLILSAHSTFDQQLAASSLYLSLVNQGKKAHLLGVNQVDNSSIKGLENLRTELGNDNLLISFEYSPESVDNVSYHVDDQNNRFYLTIKPKKGFPPLNTQSIECDYVGANADLIVLFDVLSLDELNQLYFGYESVYDSANVLMIGSSEPSYQCDRLDTSAFSSVCELVYSLIALGSLFIDADIATNLLAGIQYETNDFLDPRANAKTFESIARLLELGARRKIGGFKDITTEKIKFDINQAPIKALNLPVSSKKNIIMAHVPPTEETNEPREVRGSFSSGSSISPSEKTSGSKPRHKNTSIDKKEILTQKIIRPAALRR